MTGNLKNQGFILISPLQVGISEIKEENQKLSIFCEFTESLEIFFLKPLQTI